MEQVTLLSVLSDTKGLFRHTHTSNESSHRLGDSQYSESLEESSSRAKNSKAFENWQIMEMRAPARQVTPRILQAEKETGLRAQRPPKWIENKNFKKTLLTEHHTFRCL